MNGLTGLVKAISDKKNWAEFRNAGAAGLDISAEPGFAEDPSAMPVERTTSEAYAQYPVGTQVRDKMSGNEGVVVDHPEGNFGDVIYMKGPDGKEVAVRCDQVQSLAEIAPVAAPVAEPVQAPPPPVAEGGKPEEEALLAANLKTQADQYREKVRAGKELLKAAAGMEDSTVITAPQDDRKLTFAQLKATLKAESLGNESAAPAGRRGGNVPYKAKPPKENLVRVSRPDKEVTSATSGPKLLSYASVAKFIGYIPEGWDRLVAALHRDGLNLVAKKYDPTIADMAAKGMSDDEIRFEACQMALAGGLKAINAEIKKVRAGGLQMRRVGSNMTEVHLGDKVILFSYNTPVAATIDGKSYKTAKKWSSTTSSHINKWLGADSASAETKPQEFFDQLDPGAALAKNAAETGKSEIEGALKADLKARRDEFVKVRAAGEHIENKQQALELWVANDEGLYNIVRRARNADQIKQQFEEIWPTLGKGDSQYLKNDVPDLEGIDWQAVYDNEHEDDEEEEIEASLAVKAEPAPITPPVPTAPVPAKVPNKVPPVPSAQAQVPGQVAKIGDTPGLVPMVAKVSAARKLRSAKIVAADKPMPTTPAPTGKRWAWDATLNNNMGDWSLVQASKSLKAEMQEGIVEAEGDEDFKDQDYYCSLCGKDLVPGDKYYSNYGTGIDAYPHYCCPEHLQEAVKSGSDASNRADEEADPHAEEFGGGHQPEPRLFKGSAWAVIAAKKGITFAADKYEPKEGSSKVYQKSEDQGEKEGDLIDFAPDAGPDEWINGWSFVKKLKKEDATPEELEALEESIGAGFILEEEADEPGFEFSIYKRGDDTHADIPGAGSVRKKDGDMSAEVTAAADAPAQGKSLYELLKEAGCEMDNHESDLYVKDTPEAHAVLLKYEEGGRDGKTSFQKFRSEKDGEMWIDIPFAFQPWWEQRVGKGRSAEVSETAGKAIPAKEEKSEPYTDRGAGSPGAGGEDKPKKEEKKDEPKKDEKKPESKKKEDKGK